MRVKLLGLAAVAAVCACERPETYAATVRFAVPADKLPDPLEVPWPSDLYKTDADGTIADGIVRWTNTGLNPARLALESYGALDGFGRNSAALFLVDEEVELDASSLPAWGAACGASDSPVAIIDIDPASPTAGARIPCYAGVSPGTRVLVVGPERAVLAPGRKYAAVVTTQVQVAGGKLGPARSFQEIRDGSGSARSSAVGKLYGDAVDEVVRLGKIDKKRIAALAVFTTQTSHRKLKAMRDALVAGAFGPVPTVLTSGLPAPFGLYRFGRTAHAGWTTTLPELLGTPRLDGNGKHLSGLPGGDEPASTGVAHDALGAMLTAGFSAPWFIRPDDGTPGRRSSTIAFDENGDPVQQSQSTVPFTLFLPAAAPPPNGYPVAIYQHGATHQRFAAAALANEFARAGIATIAIDAPFHGLRAPGATDTTSFGRGTWSGPDGFADQFADLNGARAMLADWVNVLALRDHAWQAALDLVQLRRLLSRQPDLSPVADEYGGTAPRLDLTRIAYVGTSMGGILGALVAAIEPASSIDPFVLNVPAAAGLTTGFADGPQASVVGLYVNAATGLPIDVYQGRLRLFPNLSQGLGDGFDPGSFADELVAGDHNLWVLSADHDEALASAATDTLAHALALSRLGPPGREILGLATQPGPLRAADQGGRVRAFYSASPANHTFLLFRYARQLLEPPWPRATDPSFPTLPSPQVVRQPAIGAQRAVVHFFTSAWAGAAEVAVEGAEYPGLAAVHDFDDDGFCDATETAAGTSAFDAATRPAGAPDCSRDVGF